MRRVLKNNALLLLQPAWFCRSWAADGYPVRRYSELDLQGWIAKASIVIRDSVFFRGLHILPRRVVRLIRILTLNRTLRFKYKKLTANYSHYWMADSDAVNSMDPFEAILYFVTRGDFCINYPRLASQFLVRTGPLIFRICKAK